MTLLFTPYMVVRLTGSGRSVITPWASSVKLTSSHTERWFRQAADLPSPRAGPLNWVLRGSRAMFPTSLVSGIIRFEWYALKERHRTVFFGWMRHVISSYPHVIISWHTNHTVPVYCIFVFRKNRITKNKNNVFHVRDASEPASLNMLTELLADNATAHS